MFHQFNIYHFANSNNVEFKKLGSLIEFIRTGFAAGKAEQETTVGVIQIRPTNINEDRQLIFDRNVYLPRTLLQDFPSDRLTSGEVLFNNTNSQSLVGKSVYFNIAGDYFCSNHMTRIKVDTRLIDPQYLNYIINAYQRMKIFFRMCVNWNNQSGINAETLKKLLIPVPPLAQQRLIVSEVVALESHAERLKQQAQVKLDQAKQQVDHLILGN